MKEDPQIEDNPVKLLLSDREGSKVWKHRPRLGQQHGLHSLLWVWW